jgi:hypothetical protein
LVHDTVRRVAHSSMECPVMAHTLHRWDVRYSLTYTQRQ